MSFAIGMAAVAAATAPVAPAVSEGVTSYPATFFANFQPTTALDMVDHLPGFSFDSGDQVRGFGGAAGNVLIDGARPASKDDGLESILRRIAASSVLRIEVIRGGAPGIDMHGKSVIANIIRRKDLAGSVTVTGLISHAYDGRLAGQALVSGEKRLGIFAFEGSLAAMKFIDDGGGTGIWTRAKGSGAQVVDARETAPGADQIYKATGAIEFPLLGGKLRLNSSLVIDAYTSNTLDTLIPPPGTELDHFHQRQDSAELGLRFERPLTPKLTAEVYLLQQLHSSELTDDFTGSAAAVAVTGDSLSALFDLHKRTAESIGRFTLKYQAAKSLSFELGAEGDYNWLRTRTSYVQDGAVVALPAANVRVDEKRGEAFATATWQPHPKVTLEVGVKGEVSRIASTGDVISSHSFAFPKPRLLFTWSPTLVDQLRLHVEREVGQLNFDDFTAQTVGLNTGTVQAGNPRLNPSRDWLFEAAWERRFWGSADLTLTLRHYALTDVVDRVPDPSGTFDTPGNIGSGTTNTAVVALTLPLDKLGLKRATLTGLGTFRRSAVTDPTTGRPRGISGQHPRDWELHFTRSEPRWKATWGADVNGMWKQTFYRFNEVDTDKLKTYVGIFAEYKPGANLTLRAEILNLGARGIEHSREIYAGPRSTTPLDFTDVRHLGIGRFFRFKIVKTFN